MVIFQEGGIMDICIIGSGHVGLVTGACLAELGNNVICVDVNKKKIEGLKKGIVPIFEPGLEELVRRNKKRGKLHFTTNSNQAIKKSLIIFIAVNTPPKPNGEADLIYVENVSHQIAGCMPSYRLIVEKSTVPVDTGRWIKHTIQLSNKRKVNFDVACNPEFLSEGSAVKNFMHPDRVVIGVESKKAKELLIKLYKPLGATIVITNVKSAEIIKHASNSFLATKISFVNAVSNICEKVGADIKEVTRGMGFDKRIANIFLNAGVGFGGSCFPKDLAAFRHLAEKLGYDFGLLKEVEKINKQQKEILVKKIKDHVWNLENKTIGILGLSYKPNTDDMRFAPAVDIIKALEEEGVKIKAFDPEAMDNAKKVLSGIKFCKDPYSVARDSDCLVIITEWNEFKELDFKKVKKLLKQPLIIDGRNIYDPGKLKRMGFKYVGMGRKI